VIRVYHELEIKNLRVNKHSNQYTDPHAIDLGPFNWKSKDLDKEDLDLKAQQAALNLLK